MNINCVIFAYVNNFYLYKLINAIQWFIILQGDSRAQCDYKYQYDVSEICGYNSKCKTNAERSMEALRSFPGMKVGPRECIRDPCLYSALRSIEN